MNWKVLKNILDVVGVPGQETLVHDVIRSNLKHKNYEVENSPLGILIVKQKSKSKNRIAICSHSDEVGFFVRAIDKDGNAEVFCLGGITTHSAYGSELQFITTKGKKIFGAFVQPAIHELRLIDPPRRRRRSNLSGIQGTMYNTILERKKHFVDFGFNSKEEAEKNGLRVGCQGTFATQAKKIGSNKILAKAIDNRVGTYLNLECANLNIENKDFAIDHIFGVREEIGAASTATALFKENYKAAITLDVSPAQKEQGILGDGPLIRFKDAGHIAKPSLIDFMEKEAKKKNIKLQPYFSLGGTDASSIHTTKMGIPTLQVTMVSRSIHTGVSICDINDIDKTQELLNHLVKVINKKLIDNCYKN